MSKKINKILVELKKAIREENEGAMGDMLCGELSRLLKPKTSWADDLPKISASDIIEDVKIEGESKMLYGDPKKLKSKMPKKESKKEFDRLTKATFAIKLLKNNVKDTDIDGLSDCKDENCCCKDKCKNKPVKVKNIEKGKR